MPCHDCGNWDVKAGLCQKCLTELRYCAKCNQRRYFKNGECEVCAMASKRERFADCERRQKIASKECDRREKILKQAYQDGKEL